MFSSVQLAEGPDGLERAQSCCKPDAKPSNEDGLSASYYRDVDVVVQRYWKIGGME